MKCKEGSAEWALHQMMQGKKVCNITLAKVKAARLGLDKFERLNTFWYIVGETVVEGEANYGTLSVSSWIAAAHPYGWQIYKEPKIEPKLPKEQKIDSGEKEYTCLVCGKKMSGLDGMAEVSIKRISISSLYVESTLSHYCGKCFLKLGFDETEKELRNRQQPQVDSEPQPAREPIANCENCKHVCTNSNIGHCHMYEPKPKSQYKVGDWVEVEETATGEIEHHTVERVNTFCPVLPDYLVDDVWFNHNGMEITPLDCTFNHRRITRKLSPSEVIVRIGCLSGTVEDLSYAEDGRFWLIGKATERCPSGMHAILYDEMLDTPTRKLVEGLLKAQEESSD